MSGIMTFIIALIVIAVAGWVFRFAGQKATNNAPTFRDMPFAVAFGYALGRIACFANGCCFGSVCNWPWAIAFPRAGAPYAEELLRHPTQLYATTWELGVCLILLALERPRRRQRWIRGWLRPTGSLFFLWVVLHSLGRLVMEWFRDDFRGLHPLGLSISSWLSLLFIALALLWFRKIKR